MKIFIEGSEEWLEPCGEVMVILSKLLLCGAFAALVWGMIAHLEGKLPLDRAVIDQPPALVTVVFSALALAFYAGGKLGIFLGRKFRERGIRLP